MLLGQNGKEHYKRVKYDKLREVILGSGENLAFFVFYLTDAMMKYTDRDFESMEQIFISSAFPSLLLILKGSHKSYKKDSRISGTSSNATFHIYNS